MKKLTTGARLEGLEEDSKLHRDILKAMNENNVKCDLILVKEELVHMSYIHEGLIQKQHDTIRKQLIEILTLHGIRKPLQMGFRLKNPARHLC